MASYKIYFLDFFHKNMLSSSKIRPLKLQNAIVEADFMKKVILDPKMPSFNPALSVEHSHFLHPGLHDSSSRPSSLSSMVVCHNTRLEQ